MASTKSYSNNRQGVGISRWLDSGEYSSDIDAALTAIVSACECTANESETASVFEREIYFLIRSRTGLSVNVKNEVPLGGVVHSFKGLVSRKSGRGRIDAMVNDLVIEYKHCSKLKTGLEYEKSREQVCDYLNALLADTGKRCSAILTDGLKIQYFSFVEDKVECTGIRPIRSSDIDMIVRAILSSDTKKLEPGNMVKDFAISSQVPSVSRNVASVLFDKLMNCMTEKSSMLFSEWKNLLHLSIDDNGKSKDIEKRRRDLSAIFSCEISEPETEYKALFALQSTYAIIVKLIACKVSDRLNFNSGADEYHDLMLLDSQSLQKFFEQMEDGYSYRNMDIRNFLEGDFFSWYADSLQWNKSFYDGVLGLMTVIDEYSAFSLGVRYSPTDVFKDLYMAIIPQSVRHSMGEYFTPEWLADSVVTKALSSIAEKKWKAIDPCCGSGIFIITLIKKIVGDVSVCDLSVEKRRAVIDEVLERVYGVDINPLSVLSARVSYYLALKQLGVVRDIEIPVFLGDSAIVPVLKKIDGMDCYSYSIDNLRCRCFDVVLPKRFVQGKDFGKIMSGLQAMVKTDNIDVLVGLLQESLSVEERSSGELMAHIRKLAGSLVELHRNHWDGIWIRIVSNFMLIARICSMDLIVGNPPWVKWEHLPAAYTRKIKEFCDIRHIFCNDGGMFGGAQLNICALISNVTASNWLKADGMLAFLMPDSLMSQNSYEEYRKFYVDFEKGKRLYLQSIDRWMAPLRPFKVGGSSVSQDFNTYFYSAAPMDYLLGIPVREIHKRIGVTDRAINLHRSWDSASELLEFKERRAYQTSPDSTAFTFDSDEFDFRSIVGPTSYHYRTGVESTPFEVFKLIGLGPSNRKGHYRFTNDVRKTSRYKVGNIPKDGWDFPVKYIYPMVGGPCIAPFKFDCADGYHIIPYEVDNTQNPVSLEKLYSECPELARYFADNRELLDCQSEKSKSMHRGEEFYALSKIGPYTFAPYMVAARDNSKFCASFISRTLTPWGELKRSICVKHTIIISQDLDGNYISEDEAHYINGVLNSGIVVAYIHNTFKTNGFSLNKARLFLPKYDSSNALFTEISRLSKIATDNESKRGEIIQKLSVAYLELCRALNY